MAGGCAIVKYVVKWDEGDDQRPVSAFVEEYSGKELRHKVCACVCVLIIAYLSMFVSTFQISSLHSLIAGRSQAEAIPRAPLLPDMLQRGWSKPGQRRGRALHQPRTAKVRDKDAYSIPL